MAISLHNSAVSTANSGTSSLTIGPITASIGDILVLQLNHEAPSGAVPIITGINDGTANVYHNRFSATQAPEPVFGASEGFAGEWAYIANALVAATITITLNAATDDAVINAAWYQGFTGTAYQTAPWDTNASLPKTAQNTSTSTAGSVSGVSTTSTAGMLLFGLGTSDWNLSPPGPGAPSGFTLVQRGTNTGGSNATQGNLFGEAYSSAVSSATITTTTPSTTLGWIVWVDALTDQGGGGGTAFTLAGAEGAFVISGKAATTAAARKIAGAEGAFVISGKAAAMAHGYKMAGAEGSFTISGQASAAVKAMHLGGAEGAFVIGGQAATLTLTTHGNFTLAGAEGSFAISGQAAALNRAAKIAGAERSFSISGQASGMLRGINLVNSAGSFTIGGQTSTELRGIKLAGAEGAFAIGGGAAVLSHGLHLAGAEGSFTIGGQAAKFSVALSIKAAEGGFVIGGGTAVMTYTPAGGGPAPVHSNPFFATPGPMTTVQ